MVDADEEAFEDNAEEYMRRDVEGSGMPNCHIFDALYFLYSEPVASNSIASQIALLKLISTVHAMVKSVIVCQLRIAARIGIVHFQVRQHTRRQNVAVIYNVVCHGICGLLLLRVCFCCIRNSFFIMMLSD